MRGLALCSLALAVSAAVRLPALADEAPAKNAGMSHGWEFSEQGGADLYGHVCAACHQPDDTQSGRGQFPLIFEGGTKRGRNALKTLGRAGKNAGTAGRRGKVISGKNTTFKKSAYP